MLIILGIGIMAAVAVGFLSYSFDPFTAGMGIRALFFASIFILITSASTLVLYAVAVAWHNGLNYYIARYFGPEQGYFKSAFRRAVLIAVLTMILISLRRYGSFTRYFAGGAGAIVFIIELLFSAHEKQVSLKSKV